MEIQKIRKTNDTIINFLKEDLKINAKLFEDVNNTISLSYFLDIYNGKNNTKYHNLTGKIANKVKLENSEIEELISILIKALKDNNGIKKNNIIFNENQIIVYLLNKYLINTEEKLGNQCLKNSQYLRLKEFLCFFETNKNAGFSNIKRQRTIINDCKDNLKIYDYDLKEMDDYNKKHIVLDDVSFGILYKEDTQNETIFLKEDDDSVRAIYEDNKVYPTDRNIDNLSDNNYAYIYATLKNLFMVSGVPGLIKSVYTAEEFDEAITLFNKNQIIDSDEKKSLDINTLAITNYLADKICRPKYGKIKMYFINKKLGGINIFNKKKNVDNFKSILSEYIKVLLLSMDSSGIITTSNSEFKNYLDDLASLNNLSIYIPNDISIAVNDYKIVANDLNDEEIISCKVLKKI